MLESIPDITWESIKEGFVQHFTSFQKEQMKNAFSSLKSREELIKEPQMLPDSVEKEISLRMKVWKKMTPSFKQKDLNSVIKRLCPGSKKESIEDFVDLDEKEFILAVKWTYNKHFH